MAGPAGQSPGPGQASVGEQALTAGTEPHAFQVVDAGGRGVMRQGGPVQRSDRRPHDDVRAHPRLHEGPQHAHLGGAAVAAARQHHSHLFPGLMNEPALAEAQDTAVRRTQTHGQSILPVGPLTVVPFTLC